MILIFSQNFDVSTCQVIDWINFLGGEFIRINDDNIIRTNFSHYLSNVDSTIEFLNDKNKFVPLNKIHSIWYRRSKLPEIDGMEKIKNIDEYYRINKNISSEYKTLLKYLFVVEKDKKKLGSFMRRNVNKLESLQIAKKSGLNIPPTLVTNSKQKLKRFQNRYNEIIIKPLSNGMFLGYNNKHYTNYTMKITKRNLAEIPNTFFPSLFQKLILKEYEVRTFFLNDVCYSMAIFSQNDKQTRIDFRDYNMERPNRNVPYKLPEQQVIKLKKFMKTIGLNTGSIDLIKSEDGKYYFLEVNPVGQFGMVSIPCNYNCEKEVAKYLMS